MKPLHHRSFGSGNQGLVGLSAATNGTESPPECPESVLLVSARSFEGFGASVVEGFEFKRREVVDRTVRTLGVEPLHPPDGAGFDLVDVAPRALMMDQLRLVQPDLGRREGVVVRVADTADGRVDASSTSRSVNAIDV